MREVHTAKNGTSRMQGSKRRKNKATSTTWPRERRFESADCCISSGAPGAEVLQKKHSSKLVPNDEDLSWEDFLEAVPRVIISMRDNDLGGGPNPKVHHGLGCHARPLLSSRRRASFACVPSTVEEKVAPCSWRCAQLVASCDQPKHIAGDENCTHYECTRVRAGRFQRGRPSLSVGLTVVKGSLSWKEQRLLPFAHALRRLLEEIAHGLACGRPSLSSSREHLPSLSLCSRCHHADLALRT